MPALGIRLGLLAGVVTACAVVAGMESAWAPEPGAQRELSRLRVSPESRFLVREDGAPFFWLGDTAWALFEKAVREPAPDQPAVDHYFATRAAQGFTVIQAALLREAWRHVGGHPALVPDRNAPRLRPGPADDYWDTVIYIIDRAAVRGLYLALLPAWMVNVPADHPLVQDPAVAYGYGHFLGSRFGDRRHLVWVLGGDPHKNGTDVDNPARLAMTRALAEGIADGTNGMNRFDGTADWSSTLMSYHPKGGNHSSSERLHGEPWLDFNMIQTTTTRDFANYRTVERDYARTPAKPTLDAEVAYEASHSLGGATKEPPLPRLSPWDVRRAAYWNVFAGGFGHTYGHRSLIRWNRTGEKLLFGADVPWHEALDAPGALQMAHLKRLMLSRPFLTRIPDQALLVGDPGNRRQHVRATRDADGSFGFVYLPSGGSVAVDLHRLSGTSVRAWWFDPRDGSARAGGEVPRGGTQTFRSPSSGDEQDWVLVLDDSAHGFGPPGR
ncbi:MAG: glycoside hydrolase family 140 protein [Vicinamibacterales bacterium]